MKKGWMILLLVSLGLNLGLGMRLVRLGHPLALPEVTDGGGPGGPRWERPAPGDSTGWRQFMGRRLEHLAARLDLRPDQIVTFQAAQRTTGRDMRQKRHELFEIRARLRNLTSAEAIDRQAVRTAMAEMARRQAEMDSLAAETLLDELEVLDPEQRDRYLDFLPEAGGRRGGRGQSGRNPPGR